MGNLGRRKFLLYSSAALGTSLLLKGCGQNATETNTQSPTQTSSPSPSASPVGDGIKVGILHSLSGTMARRP